MLAGVPGSPAGHGPLILSQTTDLHVILLKTKNLTPSLHPQGVGAAFQDQGCLGALELSTPGLGSSYWWPPCWPSLAGQPDPVWGRERVQTKESFTSRHTEWSSGESANRRRGAGFTEQQTSRVPGPCSLCRAWRQRARESLRRGPSPGSSHLHAAGEGMLPELQPLPGWTGLHVASTSS